MKHPISGGAPRSRPIVLALLGLALLALLAPATGSAKPNKSKKPRRSR